MPRRVTMMALAALLEVADASSDAPIAPSLQLRALLALLWRRSSGDRRPYADFWKTITDVPNTPHPNEGSIRSTYARTHWQRIARSVGVAPEPVELWTRLRGVIAEHHKEQSPEGRARSAMVVAIHEAALTREIIAKKGHPHSLEAYELIERRRAAGLSPEGKRGD